MGLLVRFVVASRFGAALLAVMLLVGCATSEFGVKREGLEGWVEEQQTTALNSSEISLHTRSFLERMGKVEEYREHPDNLMRRLHALAWKKRDRKLVAALIELCYNQAKRASDPEVSVQYYMGSAVYAYTYLFDKSFKTTPSPYEPEFLYAVRFYNYSMARVFRYLIDNKLLVLDNFSIPYLTGKVFFKKPKNELPFKLSHFNEFKISYEYIPFGFHNWTRRSGIGVPFVGVDESRRKKESAEQVVDIGSLAYPGTLLLDFAPSGENDFTATPCYLDPMKVDSVKVNGDDVPLEVDISTYLGFVLGEGSLISPIVAMMDPHHMDKTQGLYTLTPYDKNKIPVVFVHGLMSYPRTWSQMINTLLSDPDIREKYQFWLFAYPTSNPILYSADKLRRALLKARKMFDPENDDPAFDKMVLVAHSMGGLLSKIMVQNSGDIFFKKILGIDSIDDIKDLSPKEKAFLQRLAVYKRLPFVDEVVFLNVPHRGSTVTRWTISVLASKLISLPSRLVSKMSSIRKKMLVATKLKEKTAGSYVTTGVDNLDPDNPVLKTLATIPIDKNVVYHSIIGNNERAGIAGGTDGIVPYTSAHLDGAASEIVIFSGHSGQKKPAAIMEVERILHEHLKRLNESKR